MDGGIDGKFDGQLGGGVHGGMVRLLDGGVCGEMTEE